METPSSTRRFTRSQHLSAINTSDPGICLKKNTKTQEGRSALIDITNDSPIVGLAMQTPPSGFVSKRKISRIKSTPGSGEALLRGQVKILLHKVEEGTELIHSIKTPPLFHLVTSPMRLLAPTPANTPQVLNFSDAQVEIVSGHLRNFQEEEEKSMSITRSLMLDFTDKSTWWEEEDKEEEGRMKKMRAETTRAEFTGKHGRFLLR